MLHCGLDFPDVEIPQLQLGLLRFILIPRLDLQPASRQVRGTAPEEDLEAVLGASWR